jgi:hypothetical protein
MSSFVIYTKFSVYFYFSYFCSGVLVFLLKIPKIQNKTNLIFLTGTHSAKDLEIRESSSIRRPNIGAATIRATQHIINASYNQRQRFSILVLNHGRCDYSRKSARTESRQAFGSATHVLASYLVVNSSNVKRRRLYDALIICCVDYSLR